jgi:hypothetical protein
MSGDTLRRSWCIGLFSQVRANLNRSRFEGLGCVSWHTLRSTCGGYNFCGYYVEELEAPVTGAVADHSNGYACDEDARFGI